MVSILATMGQNKFTAHLAPIGLEEDLKLELSLRGIAVFEIIGRLFLCEDKKREVVFAQDSWYEVEKVHYSSINNAAFILKSSSHSWSHYPINHFRRAELILEKISSWEKKSYQFLESIPSRAIGIFALLSEETMLISRSTKAPLPFGEISFWEDKINPPSRAYLKLWELFTLYKMMPIKNSKVLDVGSSPGGWTWVLHQIGCKVISVDKAPLDPKILALPGLEFKNESAFGLKPLEIGKCDWFFSDIICYPHKLLELVNRFRDFHLIDNFVCTIKFKGQTDFETMFKFEEIMGSKLIHLSCNKHEVTWVNQNNHQKKIPVII